MFLGLCSAFKAKGHTIQHFAGFPPWYYFTATSYILLSGFFWNVWWLVSSHLNIVESVGKDLSGTSLFDYAPVWMLQLLYILLLVISLTTSMHVIVMNFVLLQLHKKREKRRQLRIRSKGRSGSDVRLAETEVETGLSKPGETSPRKNNNAKRQKHVLFNIQRTYSLGAILIAIVTPINSVIQIIHQLFFVDMALLWFPMPFAEYASYTSLVKAYIPITIQNEVTKLEAHFGDYYFYWLKNKIFNVVTLGIYERCCVRHTYGEWLDQNLVWRSEPPKGFNDDFRYFSAKLLYWEVLVVFVLTCLSSITLFITLPMVVYWYRNRWIMKLKMGGRTPNLSSKINGCKFMDQVYKFKLNTDQFLDEHIEFDMNEELWYWDNGLHAIKAENIKLRELLEAHNIEVVIGSSMYINPAKGLPQIETPAGPHQE